MDGSFSLSSVVRLLLSSRNASSIRSCGDALSLTLASAGTSTGVSVFALLLASAYSGNCSRNCMSIVEGFDDSASLPRCVMRKRPLPVFSSRPAIVRCERAQAIRFVKTGCEPLGSNCFRSSSVRPSCSPIRCLSSCPLCSTPSPAIFMIGSINDWKSGMGIGLLLQIRCDFGKLGKRSLKIFDDFGGDDVGIGKVCAVFEAFVFEPEDVEVEFVAFG